VELIVWGLQISTVVEYWFVNTFKKDIYQNMYVILFY